MGLFAKPQGFVRVVGGLYQSMIWPKSSPIMVDAENGCKNVGSFRKGTSHLELGGNCEVTPMVGCDCSEPTRGVPQAQGVVNNFRVSGSGPGIFNSDSPANCAVMLV